MSERTINLYFLSNFRNKLKFVYENHTKYTLFLHDNDMLPGEIFPKNNISYLPF